MVFLLYCPYSEVLYCIWPLFSEESDLKRLSLLLSFFTFWSYVISRLVSLKVSNEKSTFFFYKLHFCIQIRWMQKCNLNIASICCINKSNEKFKADFQKVSFCKLLIKYYIIIDISHRCLPDRYYILILVVSILRVRSIYAH